MDLDVKALHSALISAEIYHKLQILFSKLIFRQKNVPDNNWVLGQITTKAENAVQNHFDSAKVFGRTIGIYAVSTLVELNLGLKICETTWWPLENREKSDCMVGKWAKFDTPAVTNKSVWRRSRPYTWQLICMALAPMHLHRCT